jgi:hypothetical protein
MEPVTSTRTAERGDAPPLTIPEELWEPMNPEQRELFRRAERVFEELVDREEDTIAGLNQKTGFGVEELLEALGTLQRMNLVAVAPVGGDVLIRLIAVPDEHVPVVGPDARTRWIFVVRPLESPELDPAQLN